jgi:hypothetical protein
MEIDSFPPTFRDNPSVTLSKVKHSKNYSLAGLLYRPLWTFKLWPPDAPAPTDAFRTPAAEVGTYGRGDKDR